MNNKNKALQPFRSDEEMKWKVLSSKRVIDRPWLQARCDQVQLPNGIIFDEYYVLSYPTWVNVIAETKDGQLILERQYRHAIGRVSTEICAGVAEAGEEPLEAAQRELLEETGYSGGTWQVLMVISPNSGSMDNYCHCYLAKGVEKTSPTHWDKTEDIDVMLVEKLKVKDMLERGEFIQALMIAPLWKYFSMQL